ncbi:MAG: thiolase family protein [Elusimicrobia bacterium]|nr:thiolase family protein [Elusimicrobiota bacterium]
MQAHAKRIVLCAGVRTPFGHLAKSLADFSPEDLLSKTIRGLLSKTPLYPHAVDGVMIGWVGQGSHAPNIARVAVLNAGLPEKAHAVTVQANCVSGMEAICSAARHILLGEGALYLAGGTESMSTFPYAIRGSRRLKELRSLETVKANWNELLKNGNIILTDCIEEGLTDPVKRLSMAATAEVCAQMYSISREAQDDYAYASYGKALKAEESGFYDTHVVPLEQDGQVLLRRDEYPYLRENLAHKPALLAKAPLLFDTSEFRMKDFYEMFGEHILGKRFEEGRTQATVTLFNSCARSDGAAIVIVTSEQRAKDLKLEILAEIKSWAFWGINPAHMGVGPAFATALALERADLSFDQIEQIELHEAFAATCLAIFKVGREKYGHHWETKWKEGKINPSGGSIPLGHPLAATGTRVILNLLYSMKQNSHIRWGLATACAAGGLGGAMILERYH